MILSIIQNGSVVFGSELGIDFAHLDMDKIASDSKMACLIIREGKTFLGFIFGIYSIFIL